MAAKTPPSESNRGTGRHHRRREISGILLLAGGLFAGLSLISRQVVGDPMMGPGGDAMMESMTNRLLPGDGEVGGRLGDGHQPPQPEPREPRHGVRKRRGFGRRDPALRRLAAHVDLHAHL